MLVSEFLEIENNFNEAMFLTKVDNIFVKLLTAVMLNELDDVKHFITDNVYNYYQDKISFLENKGQRQMYDELNVKSSRITNIIVEDERFIIDVDLEARYMDYIIDLELGNKVSGADDHRIQVDYTLRFIRSRDVDSQGMVRRCPGCGAPMDINNIGKCSYCNRIYNLEDYDWILDSITIK